MDGIRLLSQIPDACIPCVFFDPQYRGILDKMEYGNEGESRGKDRSLLPQMSLDVITGFIDEIARVLRPQGHLFLWIDKFHLCEGYQSWLAAHPVQTVDLITWDKGKFGMGYRTRRQTEYCVVVQKKPLKAKGVWMRHDIPDMWFERKPRHSIHTHEKPVELQKALIEAVTKPGDIVVDPAAGSFSVFDAAQQTGRNFIGCDVDGCNQQYRLLFPY